MPQVAIPATHFTHSVKKNYQEHRSALIREFIQNSVDAGSTKIHFEFDEDNRSLTVQDDGCGMSREILVNALLTMSGSFKGDNSIGGFGAAKEILLFQHFEYRVTTRKDGIVSAVIGRQLDYEFVDGVEIDGDGTVFTILFDKDYDISSFEYTAQNYLSDCETTQEIFWNGNKIDTYSKRGEFIDKGLDWAKIYISPNEYANCAKIRINGVKMFDVWIGDMEYDVIVEITKPSLEILTVNRDGFVWAYQRQLSNLIYQISVDKGQFGRAFNEHKVWRGSNESYDDVDIDYDCILEHNDKKFAESEMKHFQDSMQAIAKVAKKAVSEIKGDKKEVIKQLSDTVRKEAEDRNIPNDLIERMILRTNELVCDHDADFYIKVTGKGFDKIPDHLKPGNWGKRTISWAKLWKHCIKIVFKANGISAPYSIGWVIDSDEKVEAMYTENEGINVFYMNPLLTWMCSSNHANVFHKMLMNACHEVAHMTHKHHDEHFIIHYENMLHKALCSITKTKNSWWKEYLASKSESI